MIHAISQKEVTQYYPQSGWVEHDANKIFNGQKETFETAISESRIHPEHISAIGLTNQRETTVFWDKATGEPIHNAIVWPDNRTITSCDELKFKGLERYVQENTGLVIDSYFSATKIKYILDRVEGARDKALRQLKLATTIARNI